MAYEFHYTPTGTGVISGKEVLEQTEDAINDLGNTAISGVQEALDKAEQALTNSENAVDDAQTALNTANNAEGVAIQAQNDVSNLSGTVTNIGNRVTTAEGNISNLQGRMTTAEGNITNLQGRMTTAEGNIGNLQTAVSTAQATANSAQQTATTARQQSYVFRYSSTALVASSTNSNSLLDNTDNLKVGDKVIDSSGVLFSITAIDTANSTFTIGTALIDLAQDSDVVHKTGDETVGGEKTFSSRILINNNIATIQDDIPYLLLKNPLVERASTTLEGYQQIRFVDKNANNIGTISAQTYTSGTSDIILTSYSQDGNATRTTGVVIRRTPTASKFHPYSDNVTALGETNRRWSRVYATNYYYGNDNVEFSDKFVTTDTAQTITGSKTFSSNVNVYNSDSATDVASIVLKNQKAERGGSISDSQVIYFTDSSVRSLGTIRCQVGSSGQSLLVFRADNIDSNNNNVYSGFSIISYKNGVRAVSPYSNGDISLGTANSKWSDVQTYKVNGVEPSSLSLPSGNGNDVIDISSYITALDGTSNSYTVPANGWVSISVVGTAIDIVSTSRSDSRLRASSGNVRMLYPVIKNETLDISVIGTTLAYARFIPCQGNV